MQQFPGGDIVLPKKMKRIMMTSMLLLCLIQAPAQSLTSRGNMGIDMAAAICRKTAAILFSHAFDEHWTAGGKASFQLMKEAREDTERLEHEGSFHSYEPESDERRRPGASLTLSYWPDKAYNGMSVTSGCRYERDGKPEWIIGAGYSVTVTRHIAVMLSFERSIVIRNEAKDDTIMLALCYLF